MYTCSHCKNKFNNEPYNCSNKKKYCSFECIPESGIDRPYSYEYFNLMSGIREIYGDYEGLFYKRQIGLLLKVLDELYTRVHSIFLETKYDSSPSVIMRTI